MNKRGLVKYSQFIIVRSKRILEECKKKIRQAFIQYDNKRSLTNSIQNLRSDFLNKIEVRKLLGAILP